MTNLTDELIKQLATQSAPRAYSHEVKAMAEEIRQHRERAKQAPAPQPPLPWPYNGAPLGGAAP